MKLLPSWRILCTSYSHAPCHFMQSHIRHVHVCLAVTCHLHLWQNDWDLVCATAVTQGRNRYQNKSQHRELTPEKKILPPLLQGLEPRTFQSRVRRSNHWAIPTPLSCSQMLQKQLEMLSLFRDAPGPTGNMLSLFRGCFWTSWRCPCSKMPRNQLEMMLSLI